MYWNHKAWTDFLIGTFLSDNPKVLYYLKWAGIFYVVYLAYDTFTSKIKNFNEIDGSLEINNISQKIEEILNV